MRTAICSLRGIVHPSADRVSSRHRTRYVMDSFSNQRSAYDFPELAVDGCSLYKYAFFLFVKMRCQVAEAGSKPCTERRRTLGVDELGDGA